MRPLFLKPSFSFIAAVGCALCANSAMAEASKCNGLSGYYGTQTAIVVSQDALSNKGSDNPTYGVGVVMVNGARPNAYGTCDNTTLKVNLTDDHEISRTFDGRSISWGNNTTWTKQ